MFLKIFLKKANVAKKANCFIIAIQYDQMGYNYLINQFYNTYCSALWDVIFALPLVTKND